MRLCEILCPFSAIRVVETEKGKKSETITASCKGCGVCQRKLSADGDYDTPFFR